VEPFPVAAAIEFDWSPVDTARAFTCEEDLLTALMGRRARLPRTERRWTRVDLSLDATLPYGSAAPIAERAVLGGWTAAVAEKADATSVTSWRRAGASCRSSAGTVISRCRRTAG